MFQWGLGDKDKDKEKKIVSGRRVGVIDKT